MMLVLYAGLLSLCAGCAASARHAQQEVGDPRAIVGTASELPRALIQDIDLRALTRDGRPIRIVVRRDRGGLGSVSIAAFSGDAAIGSAHLSEAEFPRADLTTLDLVYGNDGAVAVLLRYGEERRECFANDDGRDRLRVVFVPGAAPRARVDTYDGCRPAIRERSLPAAPAG